MSKESYLSTDPSAAHPAGGDAEPDHDGPGLHKAAHPDDWWRHGVVYQVYPRSFRDGNGDGVGDLAGIRSRLDYLQELGVDAVWISPIYPSPMADFGYDVTDYCGVDPLFGTLEDFDALIGEAHGRGLRVILDFVPNHTSDQHPWFVQSRRSRDNALRDFYIWRDSGVDGGPPNNWRSNFGGPAWSFDDATGQWYYHAFLAQQPDLNWRNPRVRQRMYDALRFWLARGVDGFRVDVIWHLIKDTAFRDNPPHPDWRPGMAPSRGCCRSTAPTGRRSWRWSPRCGRWSANSIRHSPRAS